MAKTLGQPGLGYLSPRDLTFLDRRQSPRPTMLGRQAALAGSSRLSVPAISLPTLSRRGHRTDRSANKPLRSTAAQALDSMLSGLKRALGQSNGGAAVAVPESSFRFSDTAPSWEELGREAARQQQELGWPTQDLATGVPSPLSLRRTFGQPGEPRLKLYRDSAAWCPYCEKVWLQLEEKQVPYVVEKINMRCYGPKPRSFTDKVPSGLLPVVELDGGKAVTESDTVMALIEETFPERPLLPPQGSPSRQRAAMLLRLERRLFSDWLQWLCQDWNSEGHRRTFIKTMEVVNEELGATEGPYFLGQELSLVDCVFAPFLERIAASLPYYKGFRVRGEGRWPHLERWFATMEQRPVYRAIQSDFFTHVHDLPPQLGGCASTPEAREFAAAIDGQDGASWHLPLPPLSDSSLEPYTAGENPPLDRLRAALRLIDNHEAVSKFAGRATGRPGSRPVMAPLADPSATWDDGALGGIDAGLRHVCHALLQGREGRQGENGDDDAHALRAGEDLPQGLPSSPVAASAAYLRDRVGVPRDLPLPAARQLRAHLNWLIDTIDPAYTYGPTY